MSSVSTPFPVRWPERSPPGRESEPLSSLFARLGGVAHSVDEVAQRLVDTLLQQAVAAEQEGLTVLLLRRA